MALTFSGSGLRPLLVIKCPINLTSFIFKESLSLFSFRFRSLQRSIKARNLTSWSAIASSSVSPSPYIRMSSILHLVVLQQFDPVFSGTHLEPMKCQRASGANDSVQTSIERCQVRAFVI